MEQNTATRVFDRAKSLSRDELKKIAAERFGDLVKAVVDVEREVLALGGELHADEEAVLLEQGSKQEHLWGINLYPDRAGEEFIEFDSVINVRPAQGNRSRWVKDSDVQGEIRTVVSKIIP